MTQADDLGRVVIPKEIRRTMRIREGDPLEIFTDREGEVIFKKYSPIGELGDFALQYAEALNRVCGLSIAVCDRDAVIAVSGLPKKGFSERRISDDVGKLTDGRSVYQYSEGGEKLSCHFRLGGMLCQLCRADYRGGRCCRMRHIGVVR